MITRGKLYVDKSDLIAEIAARDDMIFFLSRPRRFGKSTLVSTFHELFASGTECFADLKLGRDRLWHDHTYPVLRLSFNLIPQDMTMPFPEGLAMMLGIGARSPGLGAYWQAGQHWSVSLANFLSRFGSKSLVLLIDEYDAPLTSCLQEPEVFVRRQITLNNFFKTLNQHAEKFRFVFITGVSRFFSGVDSLTDLSFNPRYGALTGFTEAELTHYFSAHLEYAAQALVAKHPAENWTVAKVREKLLANYSGYCFESEASVTVCNPWSLLKFFAEPELGFCSYWLDTGDTDHSVLVQCLRRMERLQNQDGGLGNLADFFSWQLFRAALSPQISALYQQ